MITLNWCVKESKQITLDIIALPDLLETAFLKWQVPKPEVNNKQAMFPSKQWKR